MDAAAIRAFAKRDRREVEELKVRFHAEEFRARGSRAAIDASQALFLHMRRLRPDWPTDHDRADDLDHHHRLRELLDRASSALAPR